MQLRLYDTLTKEKRPFTPLDPENVRMYVCGPTVYDFAHIGNARPVIVFDVLFRLLRHLYGEAHVTYVRNITDVDDKINDRAARDFPGLPLNEAIRKVTEVTATQFHSDVKALGSLPPTFEPRATDFVLPRADGKADMVTLIKQLIARGNAYEAGGEVLFDTGSMPDYGALSGRTLDEQLAGARVAVDAHKKNPADFVLVEAVIGERAGLGRSVGTGTPRLAHRVLRDERRHLGDVFDIHGGGLDLIFPHHENELAQSRCAHGTAVMANYWMHNGFLQVEGEKMSKSLGNFVTIRELLVDWPGEVLRFNMLKTHYRSPIDWTSKSLEESARTLDDWYGSARTCSPKTASLVDSRSLSDDLNTPSMIAQALCVATIWIFLVCGPLKSFSAFRAIKSNWHRSLPPTPDGFPMRRTGALRFRAAKLGSELLGLLRPSSRCGWKRYRRQRRAASTLTNEEIDALISKTAPARVGAEESLGVRPHSRRTRGKWGRHQGWQGCSRRQAVTTWEIAR